MKNMARILSAALQALAILGAATFLEAGYKAKPWNMRVRESYPANLASEGVTIAVEPLYTDALAAQVFNKEDMVTRGIMPLAILVFNDNDFPIKVEGLSVELMHEGDRIRTMTANEVVYRLSKRDKAWIGQPMPKLSPSQLNRDQLDDFDDKFLMSKTVGPHDKGGGFLYLHIADSKDLMSYLADSTIYIPKVYREDTGSRLIFFEIGLGAAVKGNSNR